MINRKLSRIVIKSSCLLVIVSLSGFSIFASSRLDFSSPRYSTNPLLAGLSYDDPEATYEGARIVHNVTVDGVKGMRVHASFTVRYGLKVPCMMIAYFYYDDEDNTPLKTDDHDYRTKDGNVSTHANFTPAYDPAVYKDLQLFMPYEALNMEQGETYKLKFYLGLYDKEGERFFGKSGWYKFTLNMP